MNVHTVWRSLLTGCLLGTALLLTPAMTPQLVGVELDGSVYAGNGHGNGGGGGHGNGHDKHADSGIQQFEGVHANDLGKLNAAHASENALNNASANSIVGKLGAYKAATDRVDAAADDLEAQAALTALTAALSDLEAAYNKDLNEEGHIPGDVLSEVDNLLEGKEVNGAENEPEPEGDES